MRYVRLKRKRRRTAMAQIIAEAPVRSAIRRRDPRPSAWLALHVPAFHSQARFTARFTRRSNGNDARTASTLSCV